MLSSQQKELPKDSLVTAAANLKNQKDIEELELLIQRGAGSDPSINAQAFCRILRNHSAGSELRLAVATLILDRCPINVTHKSKNNKLLQVALIHAPDLIPRLSQLDGLEIHERALIDAVTYKAYKQIPLLLQLGCAEDPSINAMALERAIKDSADLNTLSTLLKLPIDPNYKKSFIHLALDHFPKAIPVLVENGMDIDQRNEAGETLMYRVVKEQSAGFGSSYANLQILFELDANPLLRSGADNVTPYQMANLLENPFIGGQVMRHTIEYIEKFPEKSCPADTIEQQRDEVWELIDAKKEKHNQLHQEEPQQPSTSSAAFFQTSPQDLAMSPAQACEKLRNGPLFGSVGKLEVGLVTGGVTIYPSSKFK